LSLPTCRSQRGLGKAELDGIDGEVPDDVVVAKLAERFRGAVCSTVWDAAARGTLADPATRPAHPIRPPTVPG